VGDGSSALPSPALHLAGAAHADQRCDDMIKPIEERGIDRADVAKCRCDVETRACFARRTESRGIAKTPRLASRATALRDIEDDARRSAPHLIFKRPIVPRKLRKQRTNIRNMRSVPFALSSEGEAPPPPSAGRVRVRERSERPRSGAKRP